MEATVQVFAGKPDFTHALKVYEHQIWLNRVFGCTLYVFVFSVVLVRALLVRVHPHCLRKGLPLAAHLKPTRYPRQHIQPYKFLSLYDTTMPTFPQALALGAFTLLTVVCSTACYESAGDDRFFATKTLEILRYAANRTGTMSFALMPLLIVTAGHTNVLVTLTQWSYNTFNVFHRFIGRLALFYAITHTVIYCIYALIQGMAILSSFFTRHLTLSSPGRFWHNFERLYWNCGVLVLILFGVLSGLPSLRHVRRMSYEVFLYGHILSTMVSIAALFIHTFFRLANGWLYLTLVAWAFDRVARLWKTRKAHRAELTDHGTVLRLVIHLPRRVSLRAGDFAYLRFPDLRFSESHPFSIAGWELSDPAGGDLETPSARSDTSPLLDPEATQSSRLKVTFLIRPYDGITRDLCNLCSNKGGPGSPTSVPLRVSFEGPYGHKADLSSYSSTHLVAGGVGISFTLPYLLQLQDCNPTPAFRFVWIIRHLQEIDSIVDLMDQVDSLMDQYIEIYVTGMEADARSSPDQFFSLSQRARTRWIPRVRFHRPPIEQVLRHDSASGGSLVLLVCGPGGLLDECRILAETMQNEGTVIDYIEEASTY